MRRRPLMLQTLAALAAGAGMRPVPAAAEEPALGVRRGRLLAFPRDHGAHPETQIEWWYLTGSLAPAAGGPVSHGFQVTFFRSRTGLAEDLPGRFAPRQLLFAHAAVTVLAAAGQPARHLHAQRIGRWDGASAAPLAHAATATTDVVLARWNLRRQPDGRYDTQVAEDNAVSGFSLSLSLAPTQPVLLQGDRGFSRKGPLETQASHYYSQPQLAASGSLQAGGTAPLAVRGTAWLDHEWSDSLLPPEAEGWDWIGMNLFDGSALTAFRLRRPGEGAGSGVFAGGSYRPAGGSGPARAFGEREVSFQPGRLWASPATGARYPVEWKVDTPAGRFTVRSLLDAQELDGAASTGSVYWEGLAELLDAGGRRVGLGYLEMTGYAARLKLLPRNE